MKRKRFAPEKIISMLCEVEVGLSQGLTVGKVCRFCFPDYRDCPWIPWI